MLLKRGLGVRGRSLAPELVDETVARNGLPRQEKKDRENASLPRSAERKLPLAVENLERPKYAEIERARQKSERTTIACQSTDRVLRVACERTSTRSAVSCDRRRDG